MVYAPYSNLAPVLFNLLFTAQTIQFKSKILYPTLMITKDLHFVCCFTCGALAPVCFRGF